MTSTFASLRNFDLALPSGQTKALAKASSSSSPQGHGAQAATIFSRFVDLPLELQLAVVGFACHGESTRFQAGACRVSRLFLPNAQPVLYHEISVGRSRFPSPDTRPLGLRQTHLLLRTFLERPVLVELVEYCAFFSSAPAPAPWFLTAADEDPSVLSNMDILLLVSKLPTMHREWSRFQWLNSSAFDKVGAAGAFLLSLLKNLRGIRVVVENGGTPSTLVCDILTELLCLFPLTSPAPLPKLRHLVLPVSETRLSLWLPQFLRHPTVQSLSMSVRSVPFVPLNWTGANLKCLRLVMILGPADMLRTVEDLIPHLPGLEKLELRLDHSQDHRDDMIGFQGIRTRSRCDAVYHNVDLTRLGQTVQGMKKLTSLDISFRSLYGEHCWHKADHWADVKPLGSLVELPKLEVLRVPHWALRRRITRRSDLVRILPATLRELTLTCDLKVGLRGMDWKARDIRVFRASFGSGSVNELPALRRVCVLDEQTPWEGEA